MGPVWATRTPPPLPVRGEEHWCHGSTIVDGQTRTVFFAAIVTAVAQGVVFLSYGAGARSGGGGGGVSAGVALTKTPGGVGGGVNTAVTGFLVVTGSETSGRRYFGRGWGGGRGGDDTFPL